MPSVQLTVPAASLQLLPPEQLTKSAFAGTGSVTTAPVAIPVPLFSTVME